MYSAAANKLVNPYIVPEWYTAVAHLYREELQIEIKTDRLMNCNNGAVRNNALRGRIVRPLPF